MADAQAIAADAKPKLPRGVRLTHNEAQGGWVLLAPERVFKADAIAAEDHGRRSRGRELGQIFRVGDERQVAGLRLRDAGHADNVHVAVTVEAALQPFCDVP